MWCIILYLAVIKCGVSCRVAEGIKLYNADKLKDALDYYKRAVNMDPKYAEAWYRASQV